MTGLAMLAVVAACAQWQPVAGPEEPPSLAASGVTSHGVTSHGVASHGAGEPRPDWPAPPAGGRALPAQQIDASALPEGYPRLVWTEGDEHTVGAYGQEGGCTAVHAELHDQTAKLVRMTFAEVTTSAGPCTMDLRFRTLTVALDAPLAGRTVVLEHQTPQPVSGS
ncbi:MAG TPA: hypothetical protein VGJ13_06550 [Pseudonocardiaceae bacterium]